MTEVQKLQNEINALNASMKKNKEENTVECNGPASKRRYTYMKGTSLRSLV